jgi:hypothetical protein
VICRLEREKRRYEREEMTDRVIHGHEYAHSAILTRPRLGIEMGRTRVQPRERAGVPNLLEDGCDSRFVDVREPASPRAKLLPD